MGGKNLDGKYVIKIFMQYLGFFHHAGYASTSCVHSDPREGAIIIISYAGRK